MQNIIALSSVDIKNAISMSEAIGLMKEAFIQLSAGSASVPLRTKIDMPHANGTALFMPAYLPRNEQYSLKAVSLFKDNPSRELPLIHALVVLFDATDGRPLALMNGETITALRTGAASGLATDLLARKDSQIAFIFGAGTQGRSQLEAICCARTIRKAYIFDIHREVAEIFSREMSKKLDIPVVVADSMDFLRQADVICTATTSPQPVFQHAYLKSGVHINAVGSYKPTEREIPGETIQAAKIIVDQQQACLSEAGDIVIPIQEGLIKPDYIYAEIGEIAAGIKQGRSTQDEITLFKSVGNAVQDLVVASRLLENAAKLSLGQAVRF
jgi:ornithine cyclodeaminase/alanine dehydrogenase-like protein (mu-crystallin family)